MRTVVTDAIEFLDGCRWDEDRISLRFLARHGDRTLLCVLPFEVLMDTYATDSLFQTRDRSKAAVDIYVKHQDAIHAECRAQIHAGLCADDELVIRVL